MIKICIAKQTVVCVVVFSFFLYFDVFVWMCPSRLSQAIASLNLYDPSLSKKVFLEGISRFCSMSSPYWVCLITGTTENKCIRVIISTDVLEMIYNQSIYTGEGSRVA